MARGSLHPSMFVQGDHSYDEWDVGDIRVPVADDHGVESHVVEVERPVSFTLRPRRTANPSITTRTCDLALASDCEQCFCLVATIQAVLWDS
jgi:hypothetical protein